MANSNLLIRTFAMGIMMTMTSTVNARVPQYLVCETTRIDVSMNEFSEAVCKLMLQALERRFGSPIELVNTAKLQENAKLGSAGQWVVLRMSLPNPHLAQAQLFLGSAKELTAGGGQSGPVVSTHMNDAELNLGNSESLVNGLISNFPI